MIKEGTKKLLIGLGIGAAILGVAYYFFFRDDSEDSSDGKIKNKNPKKLLFVGDSQTAILNYQKNTPITYTYPNELKKILEPKGYEIDVLAKGGETTSWMLKNLPAKLEGKKYDRIYIQGSGNDAINLVPFQKLKDNINKMIELGQESGADVFYIVGFDQEKTLDPNKVATTRYVPTKEEMYKRHQIYFDWQKKLGDEFPNANGIVPLFDIPKEYVADGLHPNSKGGKIFAEQIIKTL
jgi:lysophospholipase L1-like esterase